MRAIRQIKRSHSRYHIFIIAFLSALSVVMLSAAYAQRIEVSSSLNPVGSGARATGMGSAFIGVADDATAASWNPAGLIQLEKPEISGVYSFFYRRQSYSSEVHPEIETTNTMDSDGLNYASIAYPFILFNRNMIVSLNYQRLFEMNKELDLKYTWSIGPDKLYDNIRFRQEGFLYALSPAYAVQVTPYFSLGATLNFWGDYLGDDGWVITYRSFGTGILAGEPVEMTVHSKQTTSFEGINANFGFLWSFSPKFTLGGVFKTPFDADMRRETRYYQSQNEPTLHNFSDSLSTTTEDLTMKMPMSYGLGLAYRHSDSLTIALDVYRTDWSEFIIVDESGNELNPIDGRPIREGALEDTTQIRIGAEYLFIREKSVIPLRVGLFYDPEPATESLDDFYGFSIGSGYSRGRIAFDASYQYRFGRNITGDLPTVTDSADISQHTLMTSLIYYF
jgi:long-subunit fatty acid transport protein